MARQTCFAGSASASTRGSARPRRLITCSRPSRSGQVLSALLAILASASCASTPLRRQTLDVSSGTQRAAHAPLVSDGCTWFPEGSWHACCVQHDQRYFVGGSAKDRLRADRDLAACVAREGHPLVGGLMFIGSQIGGVPWLPTPFRWGFGAGDLLQVNESDQTAPAPAPATE